MPRPCRSLLEGAILILMAGAMLAPDGARAQSIEDLKNLSIEQLANVDVTSVSKRSQPLSDAPAAIYVITHDEIVRSGATQLAEILRLAPNLFIAQLSASDYAITTRGLSGNRADQSYANNLLVLIDGRSVYTPIFSGVYWDMQGVLPQDIDRIEVISGPAATLWGANAVNGVINIITRKSSETQGGLVEVDGGNLERNAAARYGGRIGPDLAYRVYAQGFYSADTETQTGASAHDHWSRPQGGFRLDWTPDKADLVTLQGDAYYGTEPDTTSIGGGNLLARWNHDWRDGSSLQVQAYYDRVIRDDQGTGFWQDTYDLDVQDSLTLGERNALVFGAGVRAAQYRITSTPTLTFSPEGRTLDLAEAFAQDTLTLTRTVRLILGLKLEDDPFSGVTPLPSIRATWTPKTGVMFWAAASRAIRSPTPFDRDVMEKDASGALLLIPDSDFLPTSVTAYEVGMRLQPTARLSLSVSGYYNHYNDLRTIEVSPDLHLTWGNELQGHTYGLDAWASYQLTDWWRLGPALDLLSEHLNFKSGATLPFLGVAQDGDDPPRQAMLKSSMNLGPKVTFDANLRYVGPLPDPHLASYEELDASLGWDATDRVRLQLNGFNLLHDRHLEFPASEATWIPRSVTAELRLLF